MSENKITKIPTEIQYLTQLCFIILDNNNIKDLPAEIQYLTQLKKITLSYNQIKQTNTHRCRHDDGS